MTGECSIRYRYSLGVRDRDEAHVGEGAVENIKIADVLPIVEGGDGALRVRSIEDREVQRLDVEMQYVEVESHLPDALEHHHVVRNVIRHLTEPERLGCAGDKRSRSMGVTACEERDPVSLLTSSSVRNETTRSVPP